MSSRQQVFMTSGVMILVIFGMVFSYYTLSRANDTTQEVQRLILEGREIGNKRGNATLGAVGNAIEEIKIIETELRDNLTTHRIVANQTNQQVQELQNQTNELIEGFNQTNEEERGKAVDEIIGAVNNNTELIKQLLEK